MTIADDLRELANLCDNNPQLDINFGGPITAYCGEWDTPFADTVRLLTALHAGPVDKARSDTGTFKATLALNKTVTLCALDYMGDVVCERVQVGTETVTRPIMVEAGTETVDVPVYVWKCPDSILAPATAGADA